ncbi:MAG: 50S ribosomal protein L3 [Candidatus Bathyarchaeota archaeon]|nr:MAG: 50S ribosomal protein L3 [Candidatus Bathyarchaeota archaeon]
MGRRRKRAPRRGSLAYLPRSRAKSHVGKINHWPELTIENPKLLGFAGYKVGMSFVYTTSMRKRSPFFGQEAHRPVTFIETPAMIVCGFRFYSKTSDGLKTLGEIWATQLPQDLRRRQSLPKERSMIEVEAIKRKMNNIAEIRAFVSTQPRLANVPQKKPELFEVKVSGGTIQEQFGYVQGVLGREVQATDVFDVGRFVDVIAVTKGKGIQGPVKRWGVKTLPHKSRKTVRGVGTLGAWTPHYVMYSVPRAGQMGFHQRTERNKRILKLSSEAEGYAPKGGFPHYGIIRDSYIILEGSIPGPPKRLVKLRRATHPPSMASDAPPTLFYLGVESAKVQEVET